MDKPKVTICPPAEAHGYHDCEFDMLYEIANQFQKKYNTKDNKGNSDGKKNSKARKRGFISR